MKYSFLLFLVLLVTFGVVNIWTSTYASLDIDCSNTGALFSVQNPYENIYHGGVMDGITNKLLDSCYQSDYYYRSYWNMWTKQGIETKPYYGRYLAQIFPIYSPISNTPILLQEVENQKGEYLQMSSKTPNSIFSVKDDCKQPRLSNGWINLQCDTKTYWSEDRKNIYLLSQKEPYKSAPQIQFYKYHTRILLVARNETGKITHFAYENSKFPISKKTVRWFLGKKWFHP